MNPKQYEQALVEYFRIGWPPPQFEVRHNVRLRGAKSRSKRQIDLAVFGSGDPAPLLLVEAKKHRRRIDVGVAGSTIALVTDVDDVPAIMVSTGGFSPAAERYLGTAEIGHLTITLPQARALRWIPVLEEQFAIDRGFKLLSGELVEALRSGDAAAFEDEALPYEEWLTVMYTGLSRFPRPTRKLLRFIAAGHFDDGHRYNAIRLLSDEGALSASLLSALLNSESDPEIIELLEEIQGELES